MNKEEAHIAKKSTSENSIPGAPEVNNPDIGSMMSFKVNQVLPEHLRVMPLKENETAVFRLVGSGRINPKTGEPMSPAGLSIPGQTLVIDKSTGQSYTLFNTNSEITQIKEDGSIITKPVIERVRWGKSSIINLSARHNHTYLFLMRHNANESNPFRDKSKRALFFLVGDKAKEKKQVVKDDSLLDALLIIRESSMLDMKVLAESVSIKTDVPAEQIKHDLNQLAKAHPQQIINASTDTKSKTKILAREALDEQVIMFDSINSLYYFSHSKVTLVKVKLGEDPFPALVDHLMSKPSHFREVDKKLKS